MKWPRWPRRAIAARPIGSGRRTGHRRSRHGRSRRRKEIFAGWSLSSLGLVDKITMPVSDDQRRQRHLAPIGNIYFMLGKHGPPGTGREARRSIQRRRPLRVRASAATGGRRRFEWLAGNTSNEVLRRPRKETDSGASRRRGPRENRCDYGTVSRARRGRRWCVTQTASGGDIFRTDNAGAVWLRAAGRSNHRQFQRPVVDAFAAIVGATMKVCPTNMPQQAIGA